jgi:NADH-quinone oxidoreductase subunit L
MHSSVAHQDPMMLPCAVQYAWVILALPLLSFVLNGLWTCRKNQELSSAISTLLSGLAWIGSLLLAYSWWETVADNSAVLNHSLVSFDWAWLPMGGGLVANMGMLLDPISIMMMVVICSIAFLVHIYSVGYMHEDASRGRFFPLLSLFTFSMLGLVAATNLFQMFVFWELVGVSSYQLIGFWYHKPSAVAASKKAFMITRFADAFFLLGIIITAHINGSFDFAILNSPESWRAMQNNISLGFLTVNALSVGTVLIFIGGWGKSAMFPMHIWLPDAMEGPTPVSSIIHSATMVVAGVFLTARMFPLFSAAPYTLEVIAFVGAFTAAFAAIIAVTQKDIKRILAFSTLSQLGYMMFSLGCAKASGSGDVLALGYTAAMFHVFTHAFFKCMLFLVAGSVIHIVHSNDIALMGGLRKKMPWTHGSALVAVLAISGIPPFAGYWSKDEIIMTCFLGGHPVLGCVGLFVGGLTAFYMGRFFFLIFWGEARSSLHHVHENKWMTWPIVILAIPSLLAGVLTHHWFAEVMLPPMVLAHAPESHLTWVPYVASGGGVVGLGLAWFCYGRSNSNLTAALSLDGRPYWYQVIYHKFYFDEIWLFFAKTLVIDKLSPAIKSFDRKVIDGSMDRTGKLVELGSSVVRTLQSGKLPFYLAATSFGVIFLWYLGQLPL